MSDWPIRRSLTNAIRAGMGANGAAVSRQPTSAAPPAASETVNGNQDLIERKGYFEKSTLGACAAPGVSSSKYGRGPLPRIFAVNTCGKRRM